MKLLFDQNLSFRLSQRLQDIFPGSNQVRVLGMDEADDRRVWAYAKANGFTIVTQDADFADLSLLHGPPPKVIWLRCGNQATAAIEKRLRESFSDIEALGTCTTAGWLEIY
jgi:predicted nuclease of predicted toxin-antitoxin system